MSYGKIPQNSDEKMTREEAEQLETEVLCSRLVIIHLMQKLGVTRLEITKETWVPLVNEDLAIESTADESLILLRSE